MGEWRVGIGYDIHRLGADRPLLIGGVEIAPNRGLVGHSDGDVLLHAVTDAFLGAANLPDIGEMFPDTDPAYADADSRVLLRRALERVAAAGFKGNNIDAIIHAQSPKMSRHKRPIAESIAELTGVSPNRVSVKAKTGEGMDAIGRGEAIAATVIVSLIGG